MRYCSSVQVQCEEEDSRSCYILNDFINTGRAAEHVCRRFGGNLAMIETKKEEMFLRHLVGAKAGTTTWIKTNPIGLLLLSTEQREFQVYHLNYRFTFDMCNELLFWQ